MDPCSNSNQKRGSGQVGEVLPLPSAALCVHGEQCRQKWGELESNLPARLLGWRRHGKPFARAQQVSQQEGTVQHTLVQATRCCFVKEQPFALRMFTTQARNLAGHFGEHKHLAQPLPALSSAKGGGFHSQMNKKLSDLFLPRVLSISSTLSEQGTCWECSGNRICFLRNLSYLSLSLQCQSTFFFFFPSRYFQPGFQLRSVCPQPYHFKWVSLQIDVNGAILDMKALLYLLSLVTAIANLSTDGVYLSCAKSIYWHN